MNKNISKIWLHVSHTAFSGRTNPPGLFKKNKKRFFVFFQKSRFFLKKTDKKHSELFLLHCAISPFSELHNNDMLDLLWHSKVRVCFGKVLLVRSLLCGKAWQTCTQ